MFKEEFRSEYGNNPRTPEAEPGELGVQISLTTVRTQNVNFTSKQLTKCPFLSSASSVLGFCLALSILEFYPVV